EGGHHQHLRWRLKRAQRRDQIEAAAVGEQKVEQDEGVAALAGAREAVGARRGVIDGDAALRPQSLERAGGGLLVIDDQSPNLHGEWVSRRRGGGQVARITGAGDAAPMERPGFFATVKEAMLTPGQLAERPAAERSAWSPLGFALLVGAIELPIS